MLATLLCCVLGLVPLAPPGVPRAAFARLRWTPPRMDGELDPAFEERTVPNSLQFQAIRSTSDAVLLLAPPGTGKTRVLRARLAYLLNKGKDRSSILVVTFTNHAAEQLRLRVGALAHGGMDEVWTGTFHSVCARMLREHATLLNLSPAFVVLVESEQVALLASLMEQVGMPRGGASKSTPSATAILHRIQCWKESGLRPADVPAAGVRGVAGDDTVANWARALYPEYQRRLRTRGKLDYADLALGALRLFEQFPHVLRAYRARFRHILVDELQDTSAVQYEWLRRLTGQRTALRAGSCLFAAADDDQSIYGWRGAARDNVVRFTLDWPGAEVIRMAQSYRCSPHVLASALPLLAHAQSLLPKSPFTLLAPAARVLLRGFWDSTQEGAWIAAQIAQRLHAGTPASSIAVLVRSQEQAKMLLPHLVAKGVPVAMQPAGARGLWWEAKEVRGAVHALRLVRSTADDESAAELLQMWGGLSSAALATLAHLAADQQTSLLNTAARALRHHRLPPSAAERLTFFYGRFAHWQSLARQGGLNLVLGAVAADHAGWCTDGGAAMQKLVHFASRCGSLHNLLQHSAFTSTATATRGSAGRARQPLAEEGTRGDGGAVSLLTIHRSKGLEWDVVFLPGWEEGTFPLTPSNGAIDEEWRLAYVALTRAREFAGISHVSRRNWHGRWLHRSPSQFLQVLPSSSVALFAPNQAKPYYQGQSRFRATNAWLFATRRKVRGDAAATPAVSAPARAPPVEVALELCLTDAAVDSAAHGPGAAAPAALSASETVQSLQQATQQRSLQPTEAAQPAIGAAGSSSADADAALFARVEAALLPLQVPPLTPAVGDAHVRANSVGPDAAPDAAPDVAPDAALDAAADASTDAAAGVADAARVAQRAPAAAREAARAVGARVRALHELTAERDELRARLEHMRSARLGAMPSTDVHGGLHELAVDALGGREWAPTELEFMWSASDGSGARRPTEHVLEFEWRAGDAPSDVPFDAHAELHALPVIPAAWCDEQLTAPSAIAAGDEASSLLRDLAAHVGAISAAQHAEPDWL